MAPLEIYKPFTPPCTLPSSQTSTCDTSSSSSDDDSSAPVVPRSRCTHPGRRRIGGRIYDSVLGVTCHWCRQKTVEDHVFCCHCNIAFCGGCLRNRNGEDIEVEMKDNVLWTCPKCRGGCGPGCDNCCNCGPCRKAQGLEPTGLLVHRARARGFTNVHDYLIHQTTGECEENVERRKRGKGWCQTDPPSFRKKQKRTEIDNGVEASCRKRLNFTPNASQSEEKRHTKSLQTSALQKKEVSLTAIKKHELSQSFQALKSREDGKAPPSASKDTVKKDEMLDNVQVLKSKEDEKASTLASKETLILQLKPVQDKHVQDNLQSKVASASVKAALVQPKAEPEFYESRNKVTASLPGKAHLLERDVSALQEVPPQHSHAPAEPSFHECISNHKLAVKKDLLDLDLQLKDGASNILLQVKTEEVPFGHKSSACKSAFIEQQERVDQPVEKRSENNFPVMQVKIHEQGSQHGITSSANFTGDESDTRCTFSLDFVAPSQNLELLSSSPSTSLTGQTHSPLPSNFHLYPGNSNFYLYPRTNFHLHPESSAPMPSIERDVFDGQHLKAQDCKVKVESVSSQEAQCNIDLSENMAWKACMDVSCSGRAKVDNFVPLATVKEEREDSWNVHCSAQPTKSTTQTSSLFGTVKVKAEREDVPFTIEPVVHCPINFKDGRFEVKEETIVGAPMSKLICIDDDDEVQALPTANKPETSAGLGKSSCGSFRDVSHLWKVDEFRKKLDARLSEPFSRTELEMLTAAASHRKPIYKARETRQGCSEFISEEEGSSYLDHHPDLGSRLEECDGPISRLSLLRGFFFWLEHASMLGAFKPWTSASQLLDTQGNDDCIEIDGLDCEILAVVCSVD